MPTIDIPRPQTVPAASFRAHRATEPSAPDSPHTVRATEDGYQYAGTSYDTRRDALAALLEDEGFRKAVTSKTAPEGLADPRWFDAAAVEDSPSNYDGSQLTEDKIDDMVRNLAGERTVVPIDGAGVSEVHESVWNTAAKAAGWVFGAAKVVELDERAHLWLYGAALPGVDGQIEAKQMQFGSIAWSDDNAHRYSGEPIGSVLESYALTNRPFIDGLEPHAARQRSRSRGGRSIHITRSPQEKHMTKKKAARGNAPTEDTATRGPAADKLAEIARTLGVDSMEEDAAWKVYDMMHALKQAADVETILEGGAPPAEDGGDAERALPDAEDMAQAEAENLAIMSAFMDWAEMLGLPEGATTDEQLAAITAKLEEAHAMAAVDGAPAEQRARAMADEATKLRARVAELEDIEFTRSVGDEIRAALKGKADVPTDEQRARYVATARSLRSESDTKGTAWRQYVRDVCGARVAPPSGVVMGEEKAATKGAPATYREARGRALDQVRREAAKTGEKLTHKSERSRAHALVKAQWPDCIDN